MGDLPKGISIIVCCYNGEERIEKAIEHLVAQELDIAIPWEIIVVDNASTDNTSNCAKLKLVETFSDGDYSIVNEFSAGLSKAREKGIASSKYEYIIFCDDDNWLSPTYAQQVFDLFNAKNELGIIGGRGEGVYAIDKPKWFDRVEKSYAIGKQANESKEVNGVWGAGMALRKSIYVRLLALGFRHLNTDRLKDKLSVGGDTEICLAFGKMGLKIWYDEALVFQHYVPAERINLEYANNLYYFIGFAAPTISIYNEAFDTGMKLRWSDYWVVRLGKSIIQLILMVCRPATSGYFKDPYKVVKSFYVQSQKGKTDRLFQMKWNYEKIKMEISKAAWNVKKP